MSTYDPSRLVAARINAGLSQQELADRLGKDSATVRLYELGRIVPTVAVLARFARALGSGLTDLYDPADNDDRVTRFSREMRELVDQAPSLTAGQRATLRALLHGAA